MTESVKYFMVGFANYLLVEYVGETLAHMTSLCSTRLNDNPCLRRQERARHCKPDTEVTVTTITHTPHHLVCRSAIPPLELHAALSHN